MASNYRKFYKAGSIADEQVPSVVIEIDLPIENQERVIGSASGWEKRWRDFYKKQGTELGELLKNSLPGGTYSALLVDILERTRNLFSVPMFAGHDIKYDDNVYQMELDKPETIGKVEPQLPVMSLTQQQQAFDFLASLMEDVNNRGDFPGTPVWDKADEFCHRLRDQGFVRGKFLEDFKED